MAHVNKNDVLAAMNSGASAAAAATPAVDTTPTPNYDSIPQANADNPWGDTPATSSEETPASKPEEGQDALVTASQESEKAPEPEQPRNANAQQALADTQTQVDFNIPDNFDPSTLPANFWSMSDAEQSQYLANTFGVNTPTQTPTQTAPQQSQQTAQNDEGAAELQAASNTVDPNGIYDPSKTYGRQENGSYVYSNSAAQLQRDLNRLTNAGLTVDGYFGEKTQQALNNYLSLYGVNSSRTQSQENETPGGDALTGSAREHAKSAPTGDSAYHDANRPEVHMDADIFAQNALNAARNSDTKQGSTNANGGMFSAIDNRTAFLDDLAENNPDAYMAMAFGIEDQPTPTGNSNTQDSKEYDYEQWYYSGQKAGKSDRQIADEHFGDIGFLNWMRNNVNTEEAPTTGNGYAPTADSGINDYRSQLEAMETPAAGAQATSGTETKQSPFPTPTSNGYVSTADFNANDYRNQLEQMENEPTRPMTGNSMSAALENRQPDRTMPRGYSTPANESLAGNSYSEALSRAQENQPQDANIFREDYQSMLEEMENEEPASTIPDVLPTPKAGASMAGNSYSRALADNQARPDTNIFRQDAPDVDEFRRVYEENMNRQSSSPDVRYGQQFMDDMRQLRQQFPTYSDTALFDMALFNEEMRNGQSSYYKWIANQLG